MNRLVQLSVNTPSPSSDLKVRVYYPVRLLTGPDLQIIRTYDEYLRFYGEDSFAQLLFNWNYELLCHRVSYVYSKANITKYNIDGEIKYYQDTGKYTNSTLIEPTSDKQTHKNSYLVTINEHSDNYNDFYIVFRSKIENVIEGVSTKYYYSYSVGLFGCDYITAQGDGDYEDGEAKIKNDFDLEPLARSTFLPAETPLTLDTFGPVLKNYFISCGLIVEDLGYHRYLVSTVSEESSYSLYSDIVSFEELEDHYDRYYASIYKDSRILSISSKYKMAESNIKVNIEEWGTGAYSVHISKTSGEWVGEEYFIVDPYCELPSTDTVRTFENINLLSNYIEIKTFKDPLDDSWDPTGIYELKNSFGFNDEELYLDKLEAMTNEVIDGYYSDSIFYLDPELTTLIDPELNKVYYDQIELKYYIWKGDMFLPTDFVESDIPQCDVVIPIDYNESILHQFNKLFPQALIITGPSDPINNGIRVAPSRVFWYDYQEEIPSGFALLYVLLFTSYYNEFDTFRLPIHQEIIPENRYDLRIEQSDYGVEIRSIYMNRVGRDFRYSDRAFIARAMMYRICMDISAITADEITSYINTYCSQISSVVNLNLNYKLENVKQVGGKYTADLTLLVDNRIFTKFNIHTELNYEV